MRSLIKGILFFIFLSLTNISIGQEEYVSELTANPEVKNHLLKLKSVQADTLSLPFFDDFAYPSNQLNSNLWLDNVVQVNESYGVNPVSTGVATFDVLNEHGNVYDSARVFPFFADVLTSKPLNLQGKEKVYLSFFYQPQGRGDRPEVGDSLILYFKSVPDNNWKNVWAAPGSEITEFKHVILPVNNENYLQKGFQFRFRNKASLTKESVPGLKSNSDHWNIDYLLLDENRSPVDTVYDDVVFSQRMGTVLQNYTTVPWKHFPLAQNQELQGQLTLHVKNLNPDVLQVDIRYLFQDMLNPSLRSTYTYNPANLNAFEDTTFIEDIDFDFLDSESEDSANFLIKTHLINIDNNLNRVYNDTIKHVQTFKDYYAYDDGTAEAGYGFRGIGSEVAQLAYRFNTYKPDSLIAIDILFNPTLKDTLHGESFWLTVWSYDTQQDLPGNILYEKVEPIKAIQKGFIRYRLDNPLYITDQFFIGWRQVYSNYLNIGYDRNRNNSNNTFINFNGFWQNSSESGTLMIRPVFNEKGLVTGSVHTPALSETKLNIFPNPASYQLTIQGIDQQDNWQLKIFDVTGKVVMNQPYVDSQISIDHLREGIYILKINNRLGESHTKKIVINR